MHGGHAPESQQDHCREHCETEYRGQDIRARGQPKSWDGTMCAGRARACTRCARTDTTSSCTCKIPSMSKKGSATNTQRWRAKSAGVTITFAMPVSSSRLKN